MFAQQTFAERPYDRSVSVTPEQIRVFVEALSSKLPTCSIKLDEPLDPKGEWFIDISCGEFRPNIAWRPLFGFGFFTAETGFGDLPNEVFRKPELAVLRVQQLHEQWKSTQRMSPASLAQLRQLTGTAQSRLATSLSLNQPAVSRFEKRDDVKVSTLNAYVEAMGGRLEMRVHFDDLDVSIELPSHAEAVG